MTGDEVIEAELVDERAPVDRPGLPAIPHQGDDVVLGPKAVERVLAADPYNTKAQYARIVAGRTLRLDRVTGEVRDVGEAGGIWARYAFLPYCTEKGWPCGLDGRPATPQILAQWSSDLADEDVSASQIKIGIYAVRRWHREQGLLGQPDTGLALKVLKGYRKEGSARPVKRARPLEVQQLKAMLRAMPVDFAGELTPRGVRDSLVLLAGVKGFLRRSELVSQRIEHLQVTDRGLTWWLPNSKGDREGLGVEVSIPRQDGAHPRVDVVWLARAWLRLLAEQGHHSGPLLRSIDRHGNIGRPLQADGYDIDNIVEAAAVRAGMEPEGWSGHSLRAGGATSAYKGGASYQSIQRQGRWKTLEQVMTYLRAVDAWDDNAANHIVL